MSKRSVQDFQFGSRIGEGSYSSVFKAVDIQNKKIFAIKVLSKKHIVKEKKIKYVNIEKNTLNRLGRHPGIVTLYYTFQDENSLYFVIDLAEFGELLSIIRKLGSLSEICSKFYSIQLIDAVDFMHKKGVIHRDLKPENILVNSDMRLMITDFGAAKMVDDDKVDEEPTSKSSFVGTAEYVSPELLKFNRSGVESDIWALGCIFYQFITGFPPFKGQTEYQTFEKIVNLQYQWPSYYIPESIKDIVSKILLLDPTERLEMNGLKSHKWFNNFNWNDKSKIWSSSPPKLSAFNPLLEQQINNHQLSMKIHKKLPITASKKQNLNNTINQIRNDGLFANGINTQMSTLNLNKSQNKAKPTLIQPSLPSKQLIPPGFPKKEIPLQHSSQPQNSNAEVPRVGQPQLQSPTSVKPIVEHQPPLIPGDQHPQNPKHQAQTQSPSKFKITEHQHFQSPSQSSLANRKQLPLKPHALKDLKQTTRSLHLERLDPVQVENPITEPSPTSSAQISQSQSSTTTIHSAPRSELAQSSQFKPSTPSSNYISSQHSLQAQKTVIKPSLPPSIKSQHIDGLNNTNQSIEKQDTNTGELIGTNQTKPQRISKHLIKTRVPQMKENKGQKDITMISNLTVKKDTLDPKNPRNLPESITSKLESHELSIKLDFIRMSELIYSELEELKGDTKSLDDVLINKIITANRLKLKAHTTDVVLGITDNGNLFLFSPDFKLHLKVSLTSKLFAMYDYEFSEDQKSGYLILEVLNKDRLIFLSPHDQSVEFKIGEKLSWIESLMKTKEILKSKTKPVKKSQQSEVSVNIPTKPKILSSNTMKQKPTSSPPSIPKSFNSTVSSKSNNVRDKEREKLAKNRKFAGGAAAAAFHASK
ncbi:hypothetical protein WICMUC_001462 [Wickerhamomyces mucosus]|uniref:non-specific serine/threonine protein kinase n=1 Tax=Wickerhamomyces mucosus TaxID=1378264 RepID=A0A9P8PVM2_9ASCO|nr:hypothetical protein WICMUC_001462 [Wickerhamomyces mucosus]